MSAETFGEALRRLRGDMSIRDVASRAAVGKSYISDLEKGRRTPSLTVATALDRALGAAGELVAMISAPPVIDGHGVETAQEITDILGRIHRRNRSVDPEILRQLRGNLNDIVLGYEKMDQARLISSLLRQRTWIDELLSECSHPREHRQLFRLACATSGILGYIAVGRGKFSLARAYCAEAFQLGDFAQDADLQAWARGLQSFCEYYAHDYREALRLAEDGLSYARCGPQSVRLAINGKARALGKLGDVDGVHRSVDEAYELASHNDPPEGLPSSISMECYGATQIASNAATAYVSLGMPDKVQQYVDMALPYISKSGSSWSRSLVTIDYAVSLISSKEADLDYVGGLVADALDISSGRPVVSIQQRALEFVGEAVRRWGEVGTIREIHHTVTRWGCHR